MERNKMSKEVLAIMKDISYGLHDNGTIGLSFTVYMDEGVCAQISLNEMQSRQVIEDSHTSDINLLNRGACIVDTSKSPNMKFVRYARI